ncbi:MAG: hypothetical protein ACREFX_15095, partial [Opitutaceae bacterium]
PLAGVPSKGADFRNIRAAGTDRTFEVTWTTGAPPSPGGRFDGLAAVSVRRHGAEAEAGASRVRGVRSTVLGDPGTVVLLGQTPQVRPAREDTAKLDDFWTPTLDVRREAAARSETEFIAVHEPFVGRPSIRSVTACQPESGAFPAGASALRVEHAEGVDYLIAAKQPQALTFILSDGRTVRFHGVQAVLRFAAAPGSALRWVYLYNTDRLQIGDLVLTTPSPFTARLLAVRRDPAKSSYAFVVVNHRTPIRLAGSPLLVIHPDGTTHGYTVTAVRKSGANLSLALPDDPGFVLRGNATEFLAFPANHIAGPNRVRIDAISLIRFGPSGVTVTGNAPVTYSDGNSTHIVRPGALP